MNIQEIKAKTEQTTLAFQRQLTEDNQQTQWLSHWDNDKRIRVSAHEDVITKIKADNNCKDLALKMEVVQPADASKPTYTRFVIITPKNIEFAI